MSPIPAKTETSPESGFQHSLAVLDEIRSWALWGRAATLLLLPVMIVLLCFPSAAILGHVATRLVVGTLLGLIWVASAFVLYHQRSSLTMVRSALIEQMEAATKNSARAEKLYGLSILDPLTGLYNRRFGETRLEEEIAKAERSGDPLILLAMDFDRFKQINDTLGHDAGDMALREFSRRLQRAVRACDVPIRIGGDEFLVILPDCPPDNIQTILSRMDSIEFGLNGKRVPLSFSCGMAQYQVNDAAESIIKRADERLYEVKAKKKAARAAESAAAKPEPVHSVETRADRRRALDPAATTRREPVRRSARVPVEKPVLLIGSDLLGKSFSEETVTLDVSQHGAAVLSRQKLAAEQEMIVRCLDANKEAEARIVRVMALGAGDFAYGVAFVNPKADIWGLEFPPLHEAEEGLAGLLFGCTRCGSRQVLDPADATVGAHPADAVIRACQRCGSETEWAPIMAAGSADAAGAEEGALVFTEQKVV